VVSTQPSRHGPAPLLDEVTVRSWPPRPAAAPARHRAAAPPAAPVAPPAPGPRPPASAAFVGRVPAGDPMPRRLARWAQGLIGGPAEARELADLAAAVQVPVTTGRRIAVVAVRGGAGRTAVTALLGSVFAARRSDHILVADAGPEHGSLAWRLGVPVPGDPAALGPRLLTARAGTVAHVDALLPSTPGGLRVLPAGAGPTGELTGALSRFFAITVLDCGPGVAQAGLFDVHAAVVVAPATPDGLRSTCAALDRLPAGPRSVSVVALTTTDRTGREALTGVDAALARYGVPAVWLPHDRHLAAGGPIDPARLAAATTVAATRLAGLALQRAGGR
jgi:septum site-determining protein MinD